MLTCMVSLPLLLFTDTLHKGKGPSWPWSHGSWIYNYLCIQCLSPLMLWVRISIRARCTTLSDKVCQWLATGQWFSPGPSVSSTNKTDNHDKTEILLKVVLNTINPNPIHKGKILHGGLRFYPLCQLLFVTIKTSVIALITLKIPFYYFLLNYNLQSSALSLSGAPGLWCAKTAHWLSFKFWFWTKYSCLKKNMCNSIYTYLLNYCLNTTYPIM